MKINWLINKGFLLSIALLASGCSSQKLHPWHEIRLTQEITAQTIDEHFTWGDYLERENKLFAEMQQKLQASHTQGGYRYDMQSPVNPLNMPVNWNRSFVLAPQKTKAGILMLHGLSDSPYSVRSLAQKLQQQGFYVIALRLPGHGTLPSGLLDVHWQDWQAAVNLAAHELQQHLQPNQPFYLMGYSNGAALAVNYSLNALENPKLPQPQKLVLLSPMIGISAFARLTKPVELMGHLPLMQTQLWLDVQQEYNPFKYNSFPANAAWQAHRLTRHLSDTIKRLTKNSQLAQIPPILTFHSVMDTTVLTSAIKENLYNYLPVNGSELVVFDINRHHSLIPITRKSASEEMEKLFGGQSNNYTLVKLANASSETRDIVEKRLAAGAQQEQITPLPLAFPREVVSLSHIALPFPPDDPVFGLTPRTDEFYGIRLGNLHLVGEKNMLIDHDIGGRLYSNPFYSYMEQEILRWLQ